MPTKRTHKRVKAYAEYNDISNQTAEEIFRQSRAADPYKKELQKIGIKAIKDIYENTNADLPPVLQADFSSFTGGDPLAMAIEAEKYYTELIKKL